MASRTQKEAAVNQRRREKALELATHAVAEKKQDDVSVNAFAAAMKVKMDLSRLKGRYGWWDKSQCTAERLSNMLRHHVEKGDPVDVANFCMMLHQRGERIAAADLPLNDQKR